MRGLIRAIRGLHEPASGRQQNLLIAVALSMAVMLGWQVFYAGPQVKQEQAKRELAQKQQAERAAQPPATTTPAARARPCPAPHLPRSR